MAGIDHTSCATDRFLPCGQVSKVSHMAPFAGGCRSRIPPDGGAMLMLLRPPC